MKLLPALATLFATFFLTVGIVDGSVFLISASIPLLLLVLPALCQQIYEMTPVYKRKHEQEMKDFNDVLHCINDLAALSKNKTEESIAQFKSKWPNYIKQITSSDIICRIAYEKGVWEFFNELTKNNEGDNK